MAIENFDQVTIAPAKLRPFSKFIMSIGELPTSYLDSLSYAEQVTWFCDYLQNHVIPALNNNAQALQEVQNLMTELQEYVSNYLDDLNIQEEINNKLDQMAEDGTLENIVSQYITNDIVVKVNNLANPVDLGCFLTLLASSTTGASKTDEQIRKNISDIVDAKITKYNLIVEIMPSTEQKTAYENNTLNIGDLILNCYPSIETLNTYINIANENNLTLSSLKFHCLWAKENLREVDYNTFIIKYGNEVISTLNNLEIKPLYAPILNEFSAIFTNDTITNITNVLSSIKALDINTGVCGVIDPLITYNLIDNIDAFFPHFYPYATMQGSDATSKTVYEGIERSKSGEKVLLKLKRLYPDKDIIINEVGASSYWEALAQPEKYWGGTPNAHYDINGMPMALYASGALKYYSQFKIKEMYIFWTDTIPKYLQDFFINYFERGDM